jgi:hypothetical protein
MARWPDAAADNQDACVEQWANPTDPTCVSTHAVVRGDLSQLSVALGESLRANPFGARGSQKAGCTATQVERTLLDKDYFTYFGTFFIADSSIPNNRLINFASTNCNTVDWSFWQNWDDSRAVGGSANAAIGLYYRF